MPHPSGSVNRVSRARQDDCKVDSEPLMVSLSNHEQLEPASFDKLKMGRTCAHQLLWKDPVPGKTAISCTVIIEARLWAC